MSIISTSGLARTFDSRNGPVHAVRSVDLTIAAGEIVGLLGPNGAGKTTALRMLTTLLTPTGGAATVAGHDLAGDPAGVRAACGYVAQSGGVDPYLTVREELVTQGRLYRLSRADATARAARLARDLGLGELLDRKAVTLSGGQRRRLDIAMGLVHHPLVLFLDEPTTGLDPGSRTDLWDLVRGLRDDHGTTVVLTTHYLDEADALADRLIVIDRGVVVAEGTPAALRAEYAGSPAASLQDTFLAITGRAAAPADAAPLSVQGL
ncbi:MULTISPECIES: ABC transporter ATP-binding protein [unclassified Streptomyces]|uniref:ABC transporter ATP-binding protein n=1 Tax=unclassified Streptomyces TaxID=2593676 RepID=UPI00081B7D09|nr:MULTISPECIES: ATP-binding cassette domain-containing protein [unclassified Streptomyces]MYQ86137.1 ATP-binding cassette domain-containing protein [Streptomyces sp. SID4936]SCE17640.1 ABC-2 type transport system ATP-binding protein [Streptomyces sp. DvalAA-43]